MRTCLIFFTVYCCTCFCHAQKRQSVTGTYFSKDTLQPVTLILKPSSDKSISGILITATGRDYTYFTLRNNTLTGDFIPPQPARNIQVFVKGDSLEMLLTDNGLTKQFFLSKLKISELDPSVKTGLDQMLFGKWVYFDEKKYKLINSQYFVYYPDGKLEFSHEKNTNIMNSDLIRSGKLKLKWATHKQTLYMIFETDLPLPIPSTRGSTYRVVGDTLYLTSNSGRVQKAVRDKTFDP